MRCDVTRVGTRYIEEALAIFGRLSGLNITAEIPHSYVFSRLRKDRSNSARARARYLVRSPEKAPTNEVPLAHHERKEVRLTLEVPAAEGTRARRACAL